MSVPDNDAVARYRAEAIQRKLDDEKHRAWVAEKRLETRAVKVRYERFPEWARRTLCRRMADSGGTRSSFSRGSSNSAIYYVLRNELPDESWRAVFDHPGMSKYKSFGVTSLVGEPYASDETAVAARAFAAWAGFVLVEGLPTWHYPQNTTRFEFFESLRAVELARLEMKS